MWAINRFIVSNSTVFSNHIPFSILTLRHMNMAHIRKTQTARCLAFLAFTISFSTRDIRKLHDSIWLPAMSAADSPADPLWGAMSWKQIAGLRAA
jgi:hypothetical protein